jgi:hypothetical protein
VGFFRFLAKGAAMVFNSDAEVCDYLRQPFEGDDPAVAYAAAGGEPDAMALGLPIVDQIKTRVASIKDYVQLNTVLFAAKLAFDFAIGRLPIAVPEAIKEQLWALCEQGIRALYMGS